MFTLLFFVSFREFRIKKVCFFNLKSFSNSLNRINRNPCVPVKNIRNLLFSGVEFCAQIGIRELIFGHYVFEISYKCIVRFQDCNLFHISSISTQIVYFGQPNVYYVFKLSNSLKLIIHEIHIRDIKNSLIIRRKSRKCFMDISYKGPYTIIETDDLRVTAEIEINQQDYKSDIIEIHAFVPVLDVMIEVKSAKAMILANELIEKYVKNKTQPDNQSADEHNFKLFA